MGTKIWATITILLAAIFFLNWHLYTKPWTQDVTASEQERIIHELQARQAGDCVVTRASYGFRCEEMATGKVYKVVTK